MLDRFKRSPAPTIEALGETSEGGDKLLTLEGVDTRRLHEAIKNSSGQLIFYTVPYAGLQVGILGEARGLKETPDQPNVGWKNTEVPVTSGLDYHFLVVDSGRHAEQGHGRELSETMQVYIPSERSTASHYTEGRGVQIILDTDLKRVRAQVEKRDFVLAAGNSAVVNTALALAEAELSSRVNYISLQESHGLLLLSAIKKLGVDWRQQAGRSQQVDRLVGRLEHDIVHLGILPIVLHHLGWDDHENDSTDYGELNEKRIARRLRAFDLRFDLVKARILTALSKIASEEKVPAGRNQQMYVASLTGGNFDRFVDAAVDNTLANYLGLPRD